MVQNNKVLNKRIERMFKFSMAVLIIFIYLLFINKVTAELVICIDELVQQKIEYYEEIDRI